MYYFMDSGPKFTRRISLNAGGIARDHISIRFWISCIVPEIFTIKVRSCVKLAQILQFLAPKFFRGGPPEFLDLDYLIGADSDHVVKFRVDQPR